MMRLIKNKQTAVEWLIVQIKNDFNDKALKGYEWIKIFEEAKQIEKEQMEISDEEIQKIAGKHILYNDSKRSWVVEGMKLYREQLKSKTNNL